MISVIASIWSAVISRAVRFAAWTRGHNGDSTAPGSRAEAFRRSGPRPVSTIQRIMRSSNSAIGKSTRPWEAARRREIRPALVRERGKISCRHKRISFHSVRGPLVRRRRVLGGAVDEPLGHHRSGASPQGVEHPVHGGGMTREEALRELDHEAGDGADDKRSTPGAAPAAERGEEETERDEGGKVRYPVLDGVGVDVVLEQPRGPVPEGPELFGELEDPRARVVDPLAADFNDRAGHLTLPGQVAVELVAERHEVAAVPVHEGSLRKRRGERDPSLERPTQPSGRDHDLDLVPAGVAEHPGQPVQGLAIRSAAGAPKPQDEVRPVLVEREVAEVVVARHGEDAPETPPLRVVRPEAELEVQPPVLGRLLEPGGRCPGTSKARRGEREPGGADHRGIGGPPGRHPAEGGEGQGEIGEQHQTDEEQPQAAGQVLQRAGNAHDSDSWVVVAGLRYSGKKPSSWVGSTVGSWARTSSA